MKYVTHDNTILPIRRPSPTITDIDGVELAPEMGALEAIEHLARCGAHLSLMDEYDRQEASTVDELRDAVKALNAMAPKRLEGLPPLTKISIHQPRTSEETWAAWLQFVAMDCVLVRTHQPRQGLTVTEWQFDGVSITFFEGQ